MLGARYQEWRQLEFLLHLAGLRQFNTGAEVESGVADAKNYFAQMRSLQRELGVDDNALIAAMGIKDPEGVAQIKAQITVYSSASGIK